MRAYLCGWTGKGRATALTLPPRSYLHPKLSPDERQLAIEVEGASHDIFMYDFARGALTKMSFDGASHWPLWTPDGRRLTYRSWKTGTMTMWWMPADSSGAPELLTNVGSMQSPESWSPDGATLAFTQMDDPESGSDIYTLSLDGNHTPHALIRTKFSEGSPKFSPDGKWLAYSSNESGRPEVYAMTFPGPGPNIQLSTDGGTDPVWRRDGKELYLPERGSDDGGRRLRQRSDTLFNTHGPVGSPLPGRRRFLVWHVRTHVGQLRRHGRWPTFPDDRRQVRGAAMQTAARRHQLVPLAVARGARGLRYSRSAAARRVSFQQFVGDLRMARQRVHVHRLQRGVLVLPVLRDPVEETGRHQLQR